MYIRRSLSLKNGMLAVLALLFLVSAEMSFGWSPDERFTDNGDATVTDHDTGLMWQQEDDGVARNHVDALTYCRDLTLAGFDDWRLPSVKELVSIVDPGRTTPAIDVRVFPETQRHPYWTSTQVAEAGPDEYIWTITFQSGAVQDSINYSSIEWYVRCVR